MNPQILISNDGIDDLVVWIEPLARDYTLEPGENVLITPSEGQSVYELSRAENRIELFLNSSSEFTVEQNGVLLKCGHKRKH